MSTERKPPRETTWATYGIEVDEHTFGTHTTATVRCPRCGLYRLVVNAMRKNWHCDGCYWSGKLSASASQGQGLVDLIDAAPMLEHWRVHGRPPAMLSGVKGLDELYQPRRGEVTVITGYPGDGKSTWLKWYLSRLASRNGSLFAVFSPEDMPFHLYLGQMVMKVTGVPFDLLEMRDLKLAESWIRNRFMMLDPAEPTAEGIIMEVMNNAQLGFHGLVIDPWTEVEHRIPPGMREDQYLNAKLSQIRRLARFLHIHVWIVVHPRSIDRVNKSGKKEMPVPTMDDLAGGAMWKNKPDWGLAVHRPFKAQGTEDMWVDIHVQKARFSGFLGGSLGAKRFGYNNETGIYEDGTDPNLTLKTPLDAHKEMVNTQSALRGYFDDPGWTWPPKDPTVLRPIHWRDQDQKQEGNVSGWWHDAGPLQAFVDRADAGTWLATVRKKSDVTSRRTVKFEPAELEMAFSWAEKILLEWDLMNDPKEIKP